jgi:Fe(3+) dicitrate transport protein
MDALLLSMVKKHTLLTTMLTYVACTLSCQLFAQSGPDSTKRKSLQEVIIRAWQRRDIGRMPDESNGRLNAGKKSEVISLDGTSANIALKSARQIFAKVPGVFVYDMDGSGNQLNISTRGLDPHRGWEFNIRQNGVLLNSDMYGYPASHYSAPMESYEKIELVRGTASLQYGAQFGGLLSYTTRKPDSLRPFSFESINTTGSYHLLSSYNAIGGTTGKFSYYAYYYKRHSDGYRQNARSDADAQFVQLQYRFSPKAALRAEFGRSNYLYQIPGQLNDSMFNANPRMSTRSRNYFSPAINVPSITLDWKPADRTSIYLTVSAVLGVRNSIMFDALATVPDTINRNTGLYKNRQADVDHFNSKTVELRVLQTYQLGSIEGKLAAGINVMNNDLHRQQLGVGSTGSDYDMSITGDFVRDMHFKSRNMAAFAENLFQITSAWSVSPGIRVESGESRLDGVIKYYTVNPLPNTIHHRFALLGITTQYNLGKNISAYAGISQAYRPVLFKDIIPASAYEQVDKNLADAKGYNADAGVRGKIGTAFEFDLSVFRLLYKNRMGTLLMQDAAGNAYIYRTNVGNTFTHGIELFAQYKFPLAPKLYAGVFVSGSYMNAKYYSGKVAAGSVNKSIAGNRLEGIPQYIVRSGLELLYQQYTLSILSGYNSWSYADALNTVVPPASGAVGKVPDYMLWDINATAKLPANLSLRAGVSNLFNHQYFSKRPTMYPGPGIWPGDGRNVYLTVGLKL